MDYFDDLTQLPGTSQEQVWIRERLETLSVREHYVLAATITKTPPRDLRQVVKCLHFLDRFDLCFPAGSYEQLGQFYQSNLLKLPDSVLPYVDMEQLGHLYEEARPGLFIGNCYVAYPPPDTPVPPENEFSCLRDDDWSVKLKFASSAAPEGVWLRLPDFSELRCERSIEEDLVLDALKVLSLEDCILLEARCILPEAGDLMAQYDSITELVRDGDNLGYVMGERGQGEAHWMEKFAAALEYEDCRSLKFALDISQNIRCYDWVPGERLADYAAERLREADVPEELIQSGCFDLDAYAADLLETSGYMQASGDTGYLRRNMRQFIYEYSTPSSPEMTMQ